MSLVTFHSEGKRIFGNLYLPSEESPCVICLHGLESSKESVKWRTLASRFHSEGYACLRFNFRGCGKGSEKSEGNFRDSSLTSRIRDYLAALDFLQTVSARIDMKRLGVIGSSFGGMVALAAGDQRVKAIITLATPYKFPTFDKSSMNIKSEDYILPSGNRLRRGFLEDIKEYDILKAVRNPKRAPLLILHGGSDEIVSIEQAYRLAEEASSPKRFEIIEEADHVFSGVHLCKVIDLCLVWFKKHLSESRLHARNCTHTTGDSLPSL